MHQHPQPTPASAAWLPPPVITISDDAEAQARVYDSMAHGASEEMGEIYRQRAYDIRRAAAMTGGAA